MIAGNHILCKQSDKSMTCSRGAWLNAEWRDGSNPNQEWAWRTRSDDERQLRRHPCHILTGRWGSRCLARFTSRIAVEGCQWTTAHRHPLTAKPTKTRAATPLEVYDCDTLNSGFYQIPSYNRKNLYSQELIALIFCNAKCLFGDQSKHNCPKQHVLNSVFCKNEVIIAFFYTFVFS